MQIGLYLNTNVRFWIPDGIDLKPFAQGIGIGLL